MKEIVEKNVDKFLGIVQSVQFERDPSKLIEYLVSTDFFSAPASSTPDNHGCYIGGLFEHCERMYRILKHLNLLMPEDKKYSDETLFFCAFCHDIAKIDYYVEVQKWRKDEHGKWQSYIGYGVDDKFPCGHGAKSIIIANKYVELTQEEMLAINYHMGSFLETNGYSAYIFNTARKQSPLLYMLHSADVLSIDMLQKFQKIEE